MKYTDTYSFWIIYENPIGYIGHDDKRHICPGLAKQFLQWADVMAEWARHESCALFRIEGNRRTGRETCTDETHVMIKENR